MRMESVRLRSDEKETQRQRLRLCVWERKASTSGDKGPPRTLGICCFWWWPVAPTLPAARACHCAELPPAIGQSLPRYVWPCFTLMRLAPNGSSLTCSSLQIAAP